MTPFRGIIGLALLGLAAMIDSRPARPAPSSATLDVLPDDLFATPGARPPRNAALPPFEPRSAPALSGNPLWSIPLSSLAATRDRPLFSASRRPPPRAVAGPAIQPVPVALPAPTTELPPPPLALIGSIVGDTDAIAIFIDNTTQQVLRLRRGDNHAGWELVSVLQREVTLQHDARTETLSLRRTETPSATPLVPNAPAATAGTSYAPFTPRSTPRNGESDGL
ncbi:hypothetical protein [Tardiphaga sp.]|uniref:hypothetical protein n=1 Tax=Tardiphaga sp. TaxID=1926292 RepID=UPI00260DE092|nr:hypothetical protein [Tardiphaga sp.]MDB5617777.1 hypothetical protein [Tardiphaga sp.]